MKTYEDGIREGYRDGFKDGFTEGRKEAPVQTRPVWVPTEPLPTTLPPFYGPTWVGGPCPVACATGSLVVKPDPDHKMQIRN